MRVEAKNPDRTDVDVTMSEPEQPSWCRLLMEVRRTDGSIVDAQLLRPLSWLESTGFKEGSVFAFHMSERNVSGEGRILAIEPCPTISVGAGQVVTGLFATRRVEQITRITAQGQVVLEGTPTHPAWSLDALDWKPLGEFVSGERMQGWDGPVVIEAVTTFEAPQPVYNLEVHGEHVHHAGELGLLVHNTTEEDCLVIVPFRGRDGKIVEYEQPKGVAPNNIRDMLKGLPGKSGKTGPIKEVPDAKALDDLFDALSNGGKTVNPGTYPGVVKELPDGTIIRRRPGSRSGGATIDITMPDGTIIKVHIKT